MNLIKNEKEILKHNTITLTNKRIVQNQEAWGFYSRIEIPLEKINSIYVEMKINMIGIIIGIVIIVISLFLNNYLKGYVFIGIFFGILAIILTLALRKEVIEIRSETAMLVEDVKGSEELVNEINNLIYK